MTCKKGPKQESNQVCVIKILISIMILASKLLKWKQSNGETNI